MSRPERDMKPRSAVKGLAAWIGKGSGAIVVMVLRPEDHVFWVHPQCSPQDAADVVESCLGAMIAETGAEREAEKLARMLRESRKATR